MKSLNQYIVEKLKIDKDTKSIPDSIDDLFIMVEDAIKYEGPKCNLNYIDVSNITDFSRLFENTTFNGDVSEWDVSSATNMRNMFSHCPFDGDLSKWDVSKVENMYFMFLGCNNFNSDISNWNVNNVKDMNYMFHGCNSLKNIPDWYKV